MQKYLYFHWIDYTIFGAFLVLFTLIGVVVSWLDRKKTSAKDYLTGGGQSHWTMVALSMQASFLSAIFILSGPGEIYSYGTAYCYINIACFVSIPVATRYFLPIYYKLNLISAYEYLEKRFNRTTRILASLLFCIQIILYLAIVLYAPALALSQATGFNILWSILFCGVVCTIYTCLGGMKATIWNDTIQMGVVYVGLIMTIVKGILAVGGLERVFDLNRQGGRIVVNSFEFDPTLRTTFWTQVIGGFCVFMPCYSVNQAVIQKVIGSRSWELAKKSLYLTLASTMTISLLVTLFGMIMYAFYHSCDPITSGQVEKIDQVVPLLVIELLGDHPGLPGLFMASTFSAALSSMSGCLNSLSAVVLTDFILPIYNAKSRVMSERLRVTLSRVLVFGFGILATFLGFQAHYLGKSVMQLSLTVMPSTGATLLGLVALGILLPFVNAKGAISGFVISFLIVFWLSMGSIYSDIVHPTLPMRVDGCPANVTAYGDHHTSITGAPEVTTVEVTNDETFFPFKIAFLYYGPIGFVLTTVIGIVVSLVTGKTKEVDPELLYQFSWKSKTKEKRDIKELEMEEKLFLERPADWEMKTSTSVTFEEPIKTELTGTFNDKQ